MKLTAAETARRIAMAALDNRGGARFEVAHKISMEAIEEFEAEVRADERKKITSISAPVLRFAERMQYKLDLNEHKFCIGLNPDGKGRDWKKCSNEWLLARMEEEKKELRESIYYTKDKDNSKSECADVANFAMMIFDNLCDSEADNN